MKYISFYFLDDIPRREKQGNVCWGPYSNVDVLCKYGNLFLVFFFHEFFRNHFVFAVNIINC